MEYTRIDSVVESKPKLAFSVKEFASKTSTSIPFIRTQIRAGRLKAVKRGRRILIPLDAANEFLDTRTISPIDVGQRLGAAS